MFPAGEGHYVLLLLCVFFDILTPSSVYALYINRREKALWSQLMGSRQVNTVLYYNNVMRRRVDYAINAVPWYCVRQDTCMFVVYRIAGTTGVQMRTYAVQGIFGERA